MFGKYMLSLLVAGWCVSAAYAEAGSAGSSFSLQGFGTVGLARSSSDHAEFVRDLSQPVGIKSGKWSGRIDSILGMQANWQATPEIELVGQVVSRLHYDRSHNPEVMWAFAKWEPDPRFSLRAGRIGADFMMLADSRLVGYSYLSVRPPTDFFGPLFFSHFDGADISATSPLGDGLLRGKLFAGKTHEKTAGALGTWDTSGSPVRGLVLEYVTGPWQVRANAARIRFAQDMNTSELSIPLRSVGAFFPEANAAADSLETKDKASDFLSLGVVYDNGPIQVQGMLNSIHHDAAIYQDSYAGYLLTSYRLGVVTPYVGLSRWKTQPRKNLPVVPIAILDEAYQQYMTASKVDRVTFSIGVRYDFQTHTAIKLQWDSVHAGKGKDFSYRNSDSESNGKANVLSIALDFIF